MVGLAGKTDGATLAANFHQTFFSAIKRKGFWRAVANGEREEKIIGWYGCVEGNRFNIFQMFVCAVR